MWPRGSSKIPPTLRADNDLPDNHRAAAINRLMHLDDTRRRMVGRGVKSRADSRIGFNLRFSVLCNRAQQNGFHPLESYLPLAFSAPFRRGVPEENSTCSRQRLLRAARDCVHENNLRVYETFACRAWRDVLI